MSNPKTSPTRHLVPISWTLRKIQVFCTNFRFSGPCGLQVLNNAQSLERSKKNMYKILVLTELSKSKSDVLS